MSHTYPTGDPYAATLSILDDSGASGSRTSTVEPNYRPSAYATVSCAGMACTFDASGAQDDGTIVSHVWAFGDDTSAATLNVIHTYSTPGIYWSTLTLTDNEGATRTYTRRAVVSQPPIASFTVACVKLTCVFDASASVSPDGSIVGYQWGFGDTYGSGVIVSHTYASAGSRGVLLIVNDTFEKQAWITKIVTVALTPPPIASFTSACSNRACVFDGSASVSPDWTIASHQWQFGDGTESYGAAVNHMYALPGTYTVILIVRDSVGMSAEQRTTVTVTSPLAHVGDIDARVSGQGSSWVETVTLEIHREDHGPLANVRVTGSWAHGAVRECVTYADGRCAVQLSGISKQWSSLSFSVTSVADVSYRPDRNHDPDGDSTGTTIIVKRR